MNSITQIVMGQVPHSPRTTTANNRLPFEKGLMNFHCVLGQLVELVDFVTEKPPGITEEEDTFILLEKTNYLGLKVKCLFHFKDQLLQTFETSSFRKWSSVWNANWSNCATFRYVSKPGERSCDSIISLISFSLLYPTPSWATCFYFDLPPMRIQALLKILIQGHLCKLVWLACKWLSQFDWVVSDDAASYELTTEANEGTRER